MLQLQVLNRTLGPDILPPLLVTFGLSIVIQNGLLEGFSADSRRISVGWLETASLPLGPVNVGVMPLLTFCPRSRSSSASTSSSTALSWAAPFAPPRTTRSRPA